MPRGTIKRLFEDRGYGFIKPADDGGDIWFHASKVEGDVPFAQLSVGLEVEYEARRGERGPQAAFVRVLEPQSSPPRTVRVAAAYRFLNPYNFVGFLPSVGRRAPAAAPTAMQAAFRAAGAASSPPTSSSPEEQLLGQCPPPSHDRYVGITGKIACTLEAITPLFVSHSEGIELHGEHRSYEFFKLGGQHALPATSLRGMVRSVFETVTNSCMAMLTDTRLSYHLPPAEALKLVPARVEKNDNGGWRVRLLTGTTPLRRGRRPDGPQYAAWVPRYISRMLRRSQNLPGSTPYGQRREVSLNGFAHGKPCWALVRLIQHPRRNFTFWNVEQLAATRDQLPRPQATEHVVEGYLCITNQNIENKHDERFFFYETGVEHAPEVPLTAQVCQDYSVLIEDYQQRHHDRVQRRQRAGQNPQEADGKEPAFSRFIVEEEARQLRDGDLVYAMLSNTANAVEFIVPVSVPRVAYKRSIAALLPDRNAGQEASYLAACTHYDSLCPACRVFGWVHEVKEGEATDLQQRVAYAGRVEFSHGTLQSSAQTLPPIPLAILSSPKPTTVRFYLRPKDGGVPEQWRDDDDHTANGYNGNTVLRGRKFYRHHGVAREEEYYRAGGRCDDQNRTIHDALAPGACFDFTVYFENLAPIELGALLWALEMDQQYVHRLGFAKPLGFGSVQVKVTGIQILDPAQRYASLSADGWQSVDNWQTKCVEPFKAALAQRYGSADFASLPHVQDMQALLSEPPNGLPVHYPRTARRADPEGRNFEWFMGNNRYHGYTLAPATQDKGLPLMTRDGTEVK